ncbi:MAG TPA: hypothetical protein VFA46_14140 [Actinomycetes bacterium]|nr:hypothetical protein [Actinomycetes bacterium]
MLGSPNSATMKASGDVRWILPGPRRLDPHIFGTPDAPLGFEPDVGVPLNARLTTEDGTAYTTTAMPTPFSDDWAQITGRADVRVVDRTAVAGPTTRDEIHATYEFTSPGGTHTYRVVIKRPLPQIPAHEDFGGVGLNVVQHGRTGIGTKLMPQALSYIAFWGVADLYRDGELVADDRFVHFMAIQRVRDPSGDYHLVFDEGVIHDQVHAHLILPPTAVTEGGPVDRPVETAFELPNGTTQPFLHIMYEQIDLLQGGD